MELPDFLKPLEHLTHPFPREAMAQAVIRRGESTPYLIKALEWTASHAEQIPGDWMLHEYALYLLAQFRETEAYEAAVRIARCKQVDRLLGDTISLGLGPILASVSGGSPGLIQSLVEDERADQFARSAGLTALGAMFRAAMLSRPEFSGYLGSLFAGGLRRESSFVWDGLVIACTDLGMIEHLDSIGTAFKEGLADPGIEPWRSVKKRLESGKVTEDNLRAFRLIDDAAEEMSGWYSFGRTSARDETFIEKDTEMELPDFLKPLEYLTRPFPRLEIQAAIERREESIPHLLRAIEWADSHSDEANDPEPPYMLHLFALYLLAQFREPRALALIVQLFRNPEFEELTGEVFTEGLARILASVCSGDTSLIEQLIEDDAVDEFVRGSSLGALGVLARRGLKPRHEISAYFGTLFQRLKRRPNYVWDALISNCVNLGMTEHLEEIRKLYAENVADVFCTSLKGVEGEIPLPMDSPLRHSSENYELITDTVAEMERWHCFDPNAPQEDEDWDEDETSAQKALSFNEPAPAETYVRETPKVGRNDPCPCGSGKKYKKCCG